MTADLPDHYPHMLDRSICAADFQPWPCDQHPIEFSTTHPMHCETCGAAVVLDGYPERTDGEWLHIRDWKAKQAEPEVLVSTEQAPIDLKHLAIVRADYGPLMGDGSRNEEQDEDVVALVDAYIALHARVEAAEARAADRHRRAERGSWRTVRRSGREGNQ